MRKASARKAAKKSIVSKSRKPLDLGAIGAMVANTLGGQALDITSALVEEAKKGELAAAKFLFEMMGLYPVSAAAADEEDEAAEGGNEFAKALLRGRRAARAGAGEGGWNKGLGGGG